ncbi:MAG: hypothetical protein LBV51_05690 [Acholeplasmatales bacterium]|jgi:AraC-like DNA-binding protein|nr:hypothetical protein [Acholeplasmatales bacterium]
MFELHYIGHKVIEESPFIINRPDGSFRYIFFHFSTPIKSVVNGQNVELKPGTCILYTPGTAQYFVSLGTRLNHDYIDFVVDDSSFLRNINFPVNTFINPYISNQIREIIPKIVDEKKNQNIVGKYMISNYISELLIAISRKVNKLKKVRRDMDDVKLKFEELRLNMYQDPKKHSVNMMSKEMFYSLPYFTSMYKKIFNINPSTDLDNARVEWINNNKNNIKNIKSLVDSMGFSTQEYFYRWFKERFGITPKEYFDNKE